MCVEERQNDNQLLGINHAPKRVQRCRQGKIDDECQVYDFGRIFSCFINRLLDLVDRVSQWKLSWQILSKHSVIHKYSLICCTNEEVWVVECNSYLVSLFSS